MSRVVTEPEFRLALQTKLAEFMRNGIKPDFVTGPGRSGALCSVYVSHMTGIPFLPFGLSRPTLHSTREAKRTHFLIVDTARSTGATMRKAVSRYDNGVHSTLVVFEEPPRVKFWYEVNK